MDVLEEMGSEESKVENPTEESKQFHSPNLKTSRTLEQEPVADTHHPKDKDQKFIEKLKGNPYVFVYLVLALIAWVGYTIRIKNIPLLTDVTTGKLIPVALDPHVFLRYARYIVENGRLMDIDMLRYFPNGFTNLGEFSVLSYFVAYLYKIWSFFVPSITLEQVHVLYPPIAFVVGLIAFFFLLNKIFDWKVALLSSAFLTVLPAYLYRTTAGFSDKEALAMIFLYVSLYLLVSFFMEKDVKKSWIYTVLAGLSVGGLWLTWGGVGFALLTIGVFVLVLIAIGKLKKQKLYQYSVFLAVAILVIRIWFPQRATLEALSTSLTTQLLFLALFAGWTTYLLFDRDVLKIKGKIKKLIPIPQQFVSFAILIIIGSIGLIIVYGPSYFTNFFNTLFLLLTQPQNFDRWALTVAESHQPFFVDWIGQFSKQYLAIAFLGSVFLFYETFKVIGKRAYILTGAFGLFILAFTMSRYAGHAKIFNGTTPLAIWVHLGSLVVFGAFFAYTIYDLYRNDSENYKNLSKVKYGALMLLIFFFFTIIGARSAVRLLFVLAPATAIMAGYFVFQAAEYAKKIRFKGKQIKLATYAVWIALAIFTFLMLQGFHETVSNQAQFTGPSYNQQWQIGMDWVRNNTPEDAVFAHWWDYGYWVQTGGERATLSDGGNARGGINHWIGRHLLTGGSEVEALELLAANDATHVLMISDEIGKYSAFSSIGADENYDRYSWIPVYGNDPSQTQPVEGGVNLVYGGGSALDDDVTIGGNVYPAGAAAIAGFLVPAKLGEGGNLENFEQPQVAVHLNGIITNYPLQCLYYNGQEIVFEAEEQFPGCLMIIPSVSGGQQNGVGASLWLSRDVYNTLFTKMYLFENELEYFDLAYSDARNFPLMAYEGRIIGPMKIWEVTGYPDDLNIPEEYYGDYIPEDVRAVR